ncbi:MAG TPA: hypothetical protein VF270_03685 [Ignavibacteriaceae bacterium]
MQIFKYSKFVFIIILLMALNYSCSKDSNNPADPNNIVTSEAKLTLNGAGYTNKSVTLSNGVCSYSPGDTLTAAIFSGKVDSDSLYFYVIFKGNQTGTFNWNTENGVLIYKSSSGGFVSYIGVTQGTTTISAYGSVTGKVEGSVNGKLIESGSLAELNVTGTFSATRVPDSN